MGFRELLLLSAIAAAAIASLANARYGLYAYIWYALMRPDIVAFVENKYPLSVVLAGCVCFGVLRNLPMLSQIWSSASSRLLLLLQIPLGLSFVLAVDPSLSVVRYVFYVKMIIVLFAIPVLVRTLPHLLELLLVMIVSLGFVGVKFGLYGILHGGVDVTGYGDVLGDNNFIALVLAMLIPLAWYYRDLTSSQSIRNLMLIIMGGSGAAVVMTHSRGGTLSLVLGLVIITFRSRHKILLGLVLMGCLVGAISIVRDTYVARMETLTAIDEEESASSRIVHARAAISMWKDYPLLGVGFGGMNYAVLAPKYANLDGAHVAHNTYLQMLVDSGACGLLLYLWMLLGAIRGLGRSAARWRITHPQLAAIPTGLQTSLIVFLLGATFYSCQRMDFPYMVVLCAASWQIAERALLSDLVSQDADSLESSLQPAVLGAAHG